MVFVPIVKGAIHSRVGCTGSLMWPRGLSANDCLLMNLDGLQATTVPSSTHISWSTSIVIRQISYFAINNDILFATRSGECSCPDAIWSCPNRMIVIKRRLNP